MAKYENKLLHISKDFCLLAKAWDVKDIFTYIFNRKKIGQRKNLYGCKMQDLYFWAEKPSREK